jgi:hypothetical protein
VRRIGIGTVRGFCFHGSILAEPDHG